MNLLTPLGRLPVLPSRLALACGVLAALAFAGGARAQAQEPLAPPVLVKPQAPAADPSLPQVELTSDVLRQLLLAEIAHQRGYSDPAYKTFMDLARSTHDWRLARRAMQIAAERGQGQRAYDAASLWVEYAPDSEEAKRYVQALSIAVGKIEPVLPRLKEQLAKAPDKGRAVSAVAAVVGQLPDKTRAFEVLQDLLAPYQDLLATRLALAHAAGQAGQYERGEQQAQAALKLSPGLEYAALLAYDFGARLHPEAALSALQAFVRENPQASDARMAYARALGAAGRQSEARRELHALLKESPHNPELLQRLGSLAYQMQDLPEAEKYFRQYLDETAKTQRSERVNNAVYAFLGQIAEERKHYDDALAWLDRVTGDQRFSAQLRKAVVLGKQKKVAAAHELLAALVPTDPDQRTQVILTESQILREAQRPEEAYALLKKGVEATPDSADLLYDYAMAGERLGKYDEMETALRQVIRLRPENAHAYNALGYSLADRNIRLEEAGTLLEKAVSLAPDDAFILDSLGWLQYRQGKLDASVKTLKRAYALRPDTEIAVHLGEVLWVSGDVAGARQAWTEARKKEPANEALRATLARFNVKL